VRLFRQSATRKYESVLECVRTALLDLIVHHPRSLRLARAKHL
jgi:hypothetical protein